MLPVSLSAILLAAVLAPAQISPQQIPSDEIRIRTAEYSALPPVSAIQARTDLVLTRVVVRDAQGRAVAGLHASDFQILDNGTPHEIAYFVAEAGQPAEPPPTAMPPVVPAKADEPRDETVKVRPEPRYVALFFDDASMRLGDLVQARNAAQKFIAEQLKTGDHIGIFTSSSNITVDFTTDANKLQEKLAELRLQLRRADDGPGQCPRMSPYQAHLIVNVNDRNALDVFIAQGQEACPAQRFTSARALAAIARNRGEYTLTLAEQFSKSTLQTLRSVIAHLGRMPGNRTLLLASSGFWTTTLQLEQNRIIDQALRAGVIINALDAKGLATDASTDMSDGPPLILARRPDLQIIADRIANTQREMLDDPLAVISHGTGGRFYHNNNDLDRGMRELAAAPDVAYMIGFTPREMKPNGAFHKITVKLAGRDRFTVESRRGYFAPTRREQAERNKPSFDAVVSGTQSLAEISMEVSARPESSGSSALKITARIEVRALPFQRRGGRNIETLRLVTALFDRDGKFLSARQSLIELSLKEPTLARMIAEGFEIPLTVQAPAGPYTLRHVVQESVEGKMAATSVPVQIQ